MSLRRFLRLEARRPEGTPAERPLGEPGRFGALEDRAPTAARPAAGVQIERFERAVEEPPLTLEEEPPDSQPFARCARCQVDNSRYAVRCQHCGEALDTDDQRAFNARFWAQRRAEAAQEQADAEERATAMQSVEAEAASMRRLAGEALARGIKDRSEGLLESRTALAVRLVRSIDDPRWRVAVIVALLAAMGAFLALFVGAPRLRGVLLLPLLVGSVVLFVPPRCWVARWRWGRW